MSARLSPPESCGNCLYGQTEDDGRRNRATLCRRFPAFSMRRPSQWCGEWEAGKEYAAEVAAADAEALAAEKLEAAEKRAAKHAAKASKPLKEAVEVQRDLS